MATDLDVTLAVYRHTVETTRPPTLDELVESLEEPAAEIRGALARLAATRLLVLEEDGESIRMAPPFSAIPTQHRVTVDEREYFANCAWDALGIPAALHALAVVHSRCEQTGEPLRIPVGTGGPEAVPCVAHFAVPAARWWDDIVDT